MLHVPEASGKITEELISAVDKFGKWSGEIRMLHKDGHLGWIESMCVSIYDDNEQMIGALGINRDSTERIKKAERLHYLAHYDHLTGIPNRYLFLDRVTHLTAQYQRNTNKFALVLENLSSKEEITQMAEAPIKTLERAFTIDEEEYSISCSIGIALYPDDGKTTVDLLSAADAAMYKAKHKGRATYAF